MPNPADLDRLIEDDDAAQFLDTLTEEERRPQLVTNKLGPPAASFTEHEQEIILEKIAPK